MSFWHSRHDTNFFKCTWLIHKSKQNFPLARRNLSAFLEVSYLKFFSKITHPPPPLRLKWSAPNRILSKWTELVEVRGYRS